MGRKSHRQQLNVWMNGLCVGEWSLTRSGEAFTYHDSWLNHPQARPLSLSLPFLPGNAAYRGSVVNAYFDRIQPRHWLAQARSGGLTEAWANDLLNELIDTTGQVLQEIEGKLPANFPTDVAEAIFRGIRHHSEKLAAKYR